MFTSGLVLLILGLVVAFVFFVKGVKNMTSGNLLEADGFKTHGKTIIGMAGSGLTATIGLILLVLSFF